MFRCQQCNTIVPAGTRSTKIIVQSRSKVYEASLPDPSERRRFTRGRGPRRKKKNYDRGGSGQEIVREIMVCPQCAAEIAETEKATAAAAAEAAALAATALESAATE